MEASSVVVEVTAKLLDILGFSADKITVSSGHRMVILVSSKEPKEIIGPNGEYLRALNTLVRRLVETSHGAEASNFLIDINGYHETQMDGVRARARALATRARLFKHDMEMEPLSSYERLVVHELFAEDPEIKTESVGEGRFRHIVLKYINDKYA